MKIVSLCVLVNFIQIISSHYFTEAVLIYRNFMAIITLAGFNEYTEDERTPCPRFTLENGKITYESAYVTFHCNPGYSLYGRSVRFCVSSTRYLNTTLCVKNSCKKFKNQQTSNMIIYEQNEGAVLTFTCDYGYTLNGNEMIYCDGNQWQNTKPTCLETNTKPSLSCDFESEDICGWSHDLNQDHEWKRINSQTWNGYVQRLIYQYTEGPRSTGHYMIYQPYNILYSHELLVLRLISPVYGKTTTDTCFEFYYFIHARLTSIIKVYLKKISESSNLQQSRMIFNNSENLSYGWVKFFTMLGPINEDYQIVIEGSSFDAAAVDDVRIIENCVIKTEATQTTTKYTDATDTQSIETCENRCGQTSTISRVISKISCDCDENCPIFNRCCPDYFDRCGFETTTDTVTPYETVTPSIKPNPAVTQRITTFVEDATTIKTSTTTKMTPNTPNNLVFIISYIIGTLILIIVFTIIVRRYYSKNKYRIRNASRPCSHSDVRFLTNDQTLDFTHSEGNDD